MPEIIQNSPIKLPEELSRSAYEQLAAVRNFQKSVKLSQEMKAATLAVFTFSNFVAQTCRRMPEIYWDLVQSGELLRSYPAGTHADRLPNWFDDLAAQNLPSLASAADLSPDQIEMHLRRYRQREMVRIAFRDLAGWSDLQETFLDLSELADACIQFSLHYLTERYFRNKCKAGQIRPAMIVLGMGKLGARELNFSSDVDLIFAFPDRPDQCGTQTKAELEVACLHIARDLVQLLARNSADGFVFRVDTRLRPYGEGGPLVMSFDNLESYYQAQGREWERYALIKARVVAGDPSDGNALLDRLRPFVYRRYLDFGAFESIREMKEKVRLEVRRKGMDGNIKLGAGGIREIEFFGQIFQLIRGGVLMELQERRILSVLDTLSHHHIVPETVCQELSEAYIFLRRTENRIQEMEDQQTHLLPSDDHLRPRLALSMGFESWDDFDRCLTRHRQCVHHHFSQLLGEKESEKNSPLEAEDIRKLQIVWQHPPDADEIIKILGDAGYDQPDQAAAAMANLRDDFQTRVLSATGRDRLNRLMPWVLKEAGSTEQPTIVLERIFDLLKSIQRRTSYLALLLEYPTALSHLVNLAAASPWIVSFLSRHPVLLDELLDPRTLYSPPMTEALVSGLQLRLSQGPSQDLEYQMEALRIFKQVNTLRVAASDITSVLPLMRVSDHLSNIAETILNQVVALSWRHLVEKHGAPQCRLEGESIEKGFAVVAYGKLGGLELGYGSDLDLVFLHCADSGQTQGGARPIDNTQFFARLGQRVIHILSAHTAAGVLYEVDMRLRPSGSAGVLVSHVDGYRDYQLKDAWTWEHQALIRARGICGDPSLMKRFENIRKEVLTHCASAEQLQHDVADMRAKMRRQHLAEDGRRAFDLKQGEGGLVDIEFIVQYLVLANACSHPRLLAWTDNVRLLQSLAETGVIDELTADRLRRAYLVYRSVIHRCNLQEKPAEVAPGRFLDLRLWVRKIWQEFFRSP